MSSTQATSAVTIEIVFPDRGCILFLVRAGTRKGSVKLDMTDLPIKNPAFLLTKAVKLVFHNIEHADFEVLKGHANSLYTNMIWGLEDYNSAASELPVAKITEAASNFLNENLQVAGASQIEVFIGTYKLSASGKMRKIFPDEPVSRITQPDKPRWKIW